MNLMDYISSNETIPAYISIEKKYLFMRMKKVAGSTILIDFCRKFGNAKKLKKKISYLKMAQEENMDNYFKFIIVRNPFDRIVSLWNHFSQLPEGHDGWIPHCTFKEFLERDYVNYNKRIKSHAHHHYPSMFKDGVMFVNFIGRLENIENDWKYISDRLDCNIKRLIIHNKHHHKFYIKYYDDWCINKVSKMYKKDLDCLDYEFGE